MKKIYDGLAILLKYGNNDFSPGHDIVYAGDSSEISEDDKKSLEDLGWFFDAEFDCWAHFC